MARAQFRILLVDDEPDILESLAPMLEEGLGVPVEVVTVNSATHARERIAQGERYDLVLTDERMPDMRGSELLAWLHHAQPRIHRGLMSAYPTAERAHAELFVRKPFEPHRMMVELRAVLEGRGMPPAG